MFQRLLIIGVIAAGLTFPAVEPSYAAPPKAKNYRVRSLDDYRYGYRYSQPDRPIDVWGQSSYYGHWNPATPPNPVYPDYSGGLFYGNPTFGLYGNSGYVSPYWGFDVLY